MYTKAPGRSWAVCLPDIEAWKQPFLSFVISTKKKISRNIIHLISSQFDEIGKKRKCKKKSLPRGIEPRSPALIGVNDKRKSSPLDQGRLDG
jgi:hypothetical protein